MTTKLALTDLANSAGQYLNANATFAQLNQLVQAGVVDKDLTTPPGSPADEALYIVASGNWGTGSSKAGQLAYWLAATNSWQFIVPREGWRVYVIDEAADYKFNGTAWVVSSGGGMSNPMTTAADMIVGGASGVPARLAAGTNGFVLTMVAGAIAWAAASGGMTNPMTAAGDLIIGGTSGAPARLAAGTNGYVLTLTSGVPTWAAAASGFANPMTTAGDMIVGGSGGAGTRLAKGTDGQMLLMVSGAQAWGSGPQLSGYSEGLEVMSTNAIDVSTSNVKKRVISSASTLTITGSASGRSHSFTLYIEGGAANVVTWPASFKWTSGTPAVLTAKHIITGSTIDNGTTWSVNDGGSYV